MSYNESDDKKFYGARHAENCRQAICLSYVFSYYYSMALNTPPYQKSALRPSKWPPNDPKFRDFSYFYMTYLKSKKNFFGFSQ